MIVLVVNAGADSTIGSSVGAGIGAVLVFAARLRGAGRVEPVLTWVLALVGLGLIAGVGLGADTEAVLRTGTRILCGIVWVLVWPDVCMNLRTEP